MIEPATFRLDATHHAGPAAEGHHRDPLACGEVQQVRDLLVGSRTHDRIGGGGCIALPTPQQVGIALAAGVQDSGHPVVVDVGAADDVDQRLAQLGGQ